jgi:MFS transporter, DHA1 family, solute carrier family 18 (vesicular amine transporter), member 1/2
MRRLQMVIYPIVFFDALLMFALVPLLPDYVDALDMSKAQAGAVIGIYSAATLVMALPAGRVADRFGPRRITIAGVALMTASTLVYAFAHSFWMLLAARGGQGTASAISWTAGLAWLSSGTAPERRGATLGMAMTCGSVGALLGPVLMGPLSSWLGIRTPFVLLAAVSLILTGLAAWPADVRSASGEPVGFAETIRLAARSRMMACAVLVMSLVAVVSGLVETLVPLRLGDAGYSAAAISLVLGLAGVLAAATQVTVMAVMLAVLAVPQSAVAIAVIYIVGTPSISGQYAVAFPLAAAGADEAGLPHGVVLGAMNVCWGFGFFVGPAAGAAVAQASSDRVAYLLAALLAASALPMLRSLALVPQECQEPA